MSWLLTIVGISLLVVLHELGHFAVAKAVGMRVERFSLFFGPLLVKKKIGETEYGIGPIPLGGYVKIAGMNPRETHEADTADGREPPRLTSEMSREDPRGYYRQAVWKRVAVIAAGPAMNVLVAFLILWGVYAFSAWRSTGVRVRVASVEAGMPAAGALRPGDQLLAVDGRRVGITNGSLNFSSLISAHRCAGAQTPGCSAATPVQFTIRRGGRTLQIALRPRYDASAKRTLVGLTGSGEEIRRRTAFVAAAGAAAGQMWYVTKTTVSRVVQIFTSSQARKEVHGIVGVSDVTSQAFSFSVAGAMYILALLSLSLAIINLFPFLPLDGGHLFWAIAEKLRGRAIPFAVMERASAVGIALVLVVAAIGLSNDITSLSNGSLNLHR